MAYVDADSVDAEVAVQVRAHAVASRRVHIPFYPSRARD
jgi:hypothetical protein